jgi:hypothetical protein
MKSCFLFLLFFLVQSFCTQNVVPFAIREIICNFFVNQSESFDFIIHGNQSHKVGQLINDILKVKSGDAFAYKLIQVKQGKEEVQVHQSAVLLFDTLQSYQDFHARAVLGKELIYKFLVHIIDFDDSILEKFPVPLSYDLFRFETFITQTFGSESVKLSTFVAFQLPICRKFVPVKINQFSTSEMKWKTREYFIEKFKNYNGCQLVVVIPFQDIPYIQVLFDQYGNIHSIRGIAVNIQRAISQKLNHSSFYNLRQMETQRLQYQDIPVDYELIIDLMRKPGKFNTGLTQPITAVDSLIVVSRSPTYSNFEKVFLPFEREVWVWLTVTIAVAVFIIVALKLTPKKVQDYVIGSEVSTPLLSFL